MSSMPIFAIPTPPVAGGRARREPLVDTEPLLAATAVPVSINLYQRFDQFRVTPVVGVNKQNPRDTNLQQGVTGLPQAHHFLWFGWRLKVKTYEINLGTAPNAVMFEQINRLRVLGGVTFRFSQTNILQFPLDEIPAGVGIEHVQSTHSGVTVFGVTNGHALRSNLKDVTVGQQPQPINQQQPFNVLIEWPYSTGLTPTTDVFIQSVLEGVYIKGITG